MQESSFNCQGFKLQGFKIPARLEESRCAQGPILNYRGRRVGRDIEIADAEFEMQCSTAKCWLLRFGIMLLSSRM